MKIELKPIKLNIKIDTKSNRRFGYIMKKIAQDSRQRKNAREKTERQRLRDLAKKVSADFEFPPYMNDIKDIDISKKIGVVVVTLMDGREGIVRLSDGRKWNAREGFLWAYCKAVKSRSLNFNLHDDAFDAVKHSLCEDLRKMAGAKVPFDSERPFFSIPKEVLNDISKAKDVIKEFVDFKCQHDMRRTHSNNDVTCVTCGTVISRGVK